MDTDETGETRNGAVAMITESDMETPVAARRHARRKLPWGFVIAGVAIAAAVIYLVVVNTGATAEYYMTIHQLQACSSCAGQTVRVAGFVAQEGLVKDDATQTVRFVITDTATSATPTMSVVYKGIVPDAFKAGAQVVVEGTYAAGLFHASTVLAKCPSKFQAATPGASSN
jgi:cytochrome c-type biogenesis protein CcmE